MKVFCVHIAVDGDAIEDAMNKNTEESKALEVKLTILIITIKREIVR